MALIDSSLFDSNLLSIEEDTKNANLVRDIVLGRLLKDKVITEEQAKDYSEKWQVIVVKRSWFKRWMQVFGSGKDKNSYAYKYVRFED